MYSKQAIDHLCPTEVETLLTPDRLYFAQTFHSSPASASQEAMLKIKIQKTLDFIGYIIHIRSCRFTTKRIQCSLLLAW